MIPKIIHYCWFGHNKKSKLIKRCIKSWEKYCPDYKIIEWNEDNFDINICPYVKEAYDEGKWAFVSDYVRFYVLKKYGGIYVDTDVEMLKSIDKLRQNGAFAGFASDTIIATGLILCTEENNWLCQKVLNSYDGEHFINDDPAKILAIGRRVSAILEENGLIINGQTQTVNGFTVYEKKYFNSTDGDVFTKPDKEAYSIHHYAATWFSKKKRFLSTLRRIIGQKNMQKYYKLKAWLTK